MVPLQMGSLCLFLCSFLILICIQTGDAIKCYECNSHNDSRCAQDIPPQEFIKDCSQHQAGANYSLCRKIVQAIEFEVNKMGPDSRVIRLCGWDNSNYANRCYQRSGFGGRQEVCSCEKDLCNSGNRYHVPIAVVALATALQLCVTKLIF